MFPKTLLLIFIYLLHNQLTYAKKIEEIFTCINETECDETETSALGESLSTTAESVYDATNVSTNSMVYTTQATKIDRNSTNHEDA